MRGNPLVLFDAISRRRTFPVGALLNRRSFTYVGNITAGIKGALRCGARVDGTFGISDGVALSTPDFIRAAALAMHVPAKIVDVPLPILLAAAAFGTLVSPVIAFPLTLERLDRLAGSMVVDSSAFWESINSAPPVDLIEGLRRTAEWMQERSS